MEYINPQDTYNVRYYDSYKSEVNIYAYDDEINEPNPAQATYSVTLHDAYPTAFTAIDMGWDDAELMEFDVDIAYVQWSSSASQ
jgi:hypothetical protein